MNTGAKRFLLAAIAAAAVVSLLAKQFNRYYLSVAIDVGINIILAVSLNLINGHTGQFSLGHAGFMAVGGYTAASFSIALSKIAPTAALPFIFLAALVVGGLTAAMVGLAVGVPTLRLRGDYLAIVTLGFGEIIRVILQNMESVGGASGLKGIPGTQTFFGPGRWLLSRCSLSPAWSILLTAAASSPSTMTKLPPVPWASIRSATKSLLLSLARFSPASPVDFTRTTNHFCRRRASTF
jgi:ABC-type branched-subunit amino acid transport system permease subunit